MLGEQGRLERPVVVDRYARGGDAAAQVRATELEGVRVPGGRIDDVGDDRQADRSQSGPALVVRPPTPCGAPSQDGIEEPLDGAQRRVEVALGKAWDILCHAGVPGPPAGGGRRTERRRQLDQLC